MKRAETVQNKKYITLNDINLKTFLTLLLFTTVAASCISQTNQSKSLFNGQDLSGWHMDVPAMDEDSTIQKPFIVRDDMLVSLGTPGGHLITDDTYSNYRLEVEYRFAGEPGNCGVLVHASTPRALYKMFPKSIEVQMMHENAGDFWCIVEDIKVPNMVERRGPEDEWGITEGKQRRIKNLTDDSENPVGEWNTMTVETLNDEVKVWVNGDLVNHGHDATAESGQIAIQAEGSEVEFRKVMLTPITELSGEPASAQQANNSENRAEGPLIHTVYFWLENSGSETDRRKLLDGLNTIKEIEHIKEGYVGVPAPAARGVIDDSYDFALTFIFENREEEEAYQSHPTHVKFVEEHQDLWERVVVYDAIPPAE